MSRVPAELAGAMEVLKTRPIFGDPMTIEAMKTRSRYKEVQCNWCKGSGKRDWWVEGKGQAGTTEGPCITCEGTGKVWVTIK